MTEAQLQSPGDMTTSTSVETGARRAAPSCCYAIRRPRSSGQHFDSQRLTRRVTPSSQPLRPWPSGRRDRWNSARRYSQRRETLYCATPMPSRRSSPVRSARRSPNRGDCTSKPRLMFSSRRPGGPRRLWRKLISGAPSSAPYRSASRPASHPGITHSISRPARWCQRCSRGRLWCSSRASSLRHPSCA